MTKSHLNIVAPDGTKGRTGSQRRFIVCRVTKLGGKARIITEKRSDNFGTAQRARQTLGFNGGFIWDTVEGKVV